MPLPIKPFVKPNRFFEIMPKLLQNRYMINNFSGVSLQSVYIRQSKHVNLQIDTFTSPQALLYEVEDSKVADIFMLDVSVPEDGFPLAEQIRHCTFVNMDYIAQITGTSLKLTTGQTLPTGRRCLQNVKKAVALLWNI